MKQNYFVVNGKKYYTGTVFNLKGIGSLVEATFIYYDTDRKRYVYKAKNSVGNDSLVQNADEKYFWSRFVSVTDKVDFSVHMPTTKTRKDSEVDGLFVGWIWYIFLMVVGFIFYDRIGLWIAISIAFFVWRKKKIEEEGTYIEW